MKRYIWFAAVYCCILMDMKSGKPVGSVIPQENGDCIIRWGHNPDQPMQEDVVDMVHDVKTTVFQSCRYCLRPSVSGIRIRKSTD